MRYRFIHRQMQFAPGDLVPESYGSGVIKTMLQYNRIEPVPGSETEEDRAEKAITAPPANKSMSRRRVPNKGLVTTL